MDDKMIKLWMPLQKEHDGGFVGILSDNSIDRDGEFMSKELLRSWVNNKTPLPMLANHENKLEKLIGGWHEKKLISKGANTAMIAKPFFLESNPLGKQAKSMVEEALSKGLNIGISIGAIPKGEMIEKEVDGQKFKGYTEAEILEATIVPIQSNRNASFHALAKSFDINTEVIKMTEEIKKEGQPVEEVIAQAVAEAPKEEEVKEEATEEPVKEEEAKTEEEVKPEEKNVNQDVLIKQIDDLKKEVKELKTAKKAILKKNVVEGPTDVKKEIDTSLIGMFKMKFGGNV